MCYSYVFNSDFSQPGRVKCLRFAGEKGSLDSAAKEFNCRSCTQFLRRLQLDYKDIEKGIIILILHCRDMKSVSRFYGQRFYIENVVSSLRAEVSFYGKTGC
jgi:hypothetical protein